MTKIKICGLRREADIEYVNEVKPDYIGFVFAESKRQVTKEQAKQLKGMLADDITAVGVFVNDSMARMVDLVQEGIIDVIQLHGQENDDVIAGIKEHTTVPVIQAFGIQDAEDIKRARRSKADMVLLDYKDAGSGATFDWELLKMTEMKNHSVAGSRKNPLLFTPTIPRGVFCEWSKAAVTENPLGCDGALKWEKPLFLAGGIDSGNVQEAVRKIHPYAIDVSSGVEVNGFKDKEKIKDLVRRVRDV